MRVGLLKPLFHSGERSIKWADFSTARLCEKICRDTCDCYASISENASTVHDLSASFIYCLQSAERKEIMQNLFQKDTIVQLEKDTPYIFDYSSLANIIEARDSISSGAASPVLCRSAPTGQQQQPGKYQISTD